MDWIQSIKKKIVLWMDRMDMDFMDPIATPSLETVGSNILHA